MSMPHCEHSVCVNFPTADYWQFSNCHAYQTISAHKVKEMDIGWWDAANHILWLVELKAFINPANPMHQPVDLVPANGNDKDIQYWIEELYNKAVHSLCMVYSNQAGTQACLPVIPAIPHAAKLVYLLRPLAGQEAYLTFIKDELKNRLKPFLALFNVTTVAVINYDDPSQTSLVTWIV